MWFAGSFCFAFKHFSRVLVLGFQYFLGFMHFPFYFYLYCSFFTIY